MATAVREIPEQPRTAPGARDERVRLEIGGMTCAACAARIERKLNKLDGVEASVNFATDQATVAFDATHLSVADLIKTVEGTGYTAALPSAHQHAVHNTEALRRRLVLAIALSIPLLVMAMIPPARFAGWEWVAFVLSAPVIFWSGFGFHHHILLVVHC